MKRIVFHVNGTKPEAEAACARLTASARSLGFEVLSAETVQAGAACDAAIVLGGDGTMLSAVHRFPGLPLLGLNLGSLGYLAGVEAPQFEAALAALRAGTYTVSRRTALEVNGCIALNDVVFSRGLSGHAVVLELLVDGRVATRYFADGLVIATPTGSTAYSLAAGGPILLPETGAFVVTPVCPHALSSRPLVVRDTARLSVRFQARAGAETVDVFADGASVEQVRHGGEVTVVKAPTSVALIELPDANPFEALNRKLGWSGSLIR